MYTEKELKEFPEYWTENIQNDLYFKIKTFMDTNSLNRTELATKLGVSKGYVSQILNGEFNPSIRKYTELALKTGYYPNVSFKKKAQKETEYKQKLVVLHNRKDKEIEKFSFDFNKAFANG